MSIWITKDGLELEISKMKDDHLENTIKMLIRAAMIRREESVASLLRLTPPNGDGAQMAYEEECRSAIDESWENFTHLSFKDIYKETKKRKLFTKASVEAYVKEMIPAVVMNQIQKDAKV